MMAVARHVRVLVDGAYVAMEVASAVLSPVLLVMAFCAAADAHILCQYDHNSNMHQHQQLSSNMSHLSYLQLRVLPPGGGGGGGGGRGGEGGREDRRGMNRVGGGGCC